MLFLILLGGYIYAQTDYYFLVENPSPSTLEIPVFQTLISALVTDHDTVGAVSYADSPSFLFAPLPGNTPGLPGMAAGKLLANPLRSPITAAGFAAALDLADAQSLAYERPAAPRKLIIITTAGSMNVPPPPPPKFSNKFL
jgi:hypothetical protein